MPKTKIEWADRTINPLVGCHPISDGCKNCYAGNVMFPRLKGIGKGLYGEMKDFGDITANVDILIDKLESLKKPQRIFLCSMSDLFHQLVPINFISKIFRICNEYPMHTFMILTKRYDRLSKILLTMKDSLPGNIMFGVSICNISDMVKVYTQYKAYDIPLFISFEPLLEGMVTKDLFDLIDVSWVIVGAETGNKRRSFQESWALSLLEEARTRNIPFFFKQQYIDGQKVQELKGIKYLEFPKEGNQ